MPAPCSSKPKNFTQPNSSWGSEMMRLYEHYDSQCEVETEGGQKQEGPWQKMPIYQDMLKEASGGLILCELFQSKEGIFTQNGGEQGTAFEYVLFANIKEQKCVCLFQPGHRLEGTPGFIHGGAVATMVDTITALHSTFFYGLAVTANLNINYRRPIPMGSTLLLESSLDKKEGKKIFLSCKMTSSDGSRVHTEATALFLSMSLSKRLNV
ncbi:acyl-coenzyme A thioesterase THEM4-like [Centropristis striata]|uniref:acyl-coenzyme A thioesterase THEM4-like n=1 Tax=Centropristis striata TaxID=184440 RepID=UPI0027E0B636|nr:acyl-coenzyme A thioesterase THEM4-like [Centropristis striata]